MGRRWFLSLLLRRRLVSFDPRRQHLFVPLRFVLRLLLPLLFPFALPLLFFCVHLLPFRLLHLLLFDPPRQHLFVPLPFVLRLLLPLPFPFALPLPLQPRLFPVRLVLLLFVPRRLPFLPVIIVPFGPVVMFVRLHLLLPPLLPDRRWTLLQLRSRHRGIAALLRFGA
jgi:hypothetical protein